VDALYEYQCWDPIARRRSEARLFDPTWEYDRHGLLGHRTPSSEVEVYVPPTSHNSGPCAIISPVAWDGSDLTLGVIECINRTTEHTFSNTCTAIPHLKEKVLLEPANGTPPLRLATRVIHTPDGKSTNTPVGLAIALNNEDRNVKTVS
jgi:hypothetical protein